MFAIFRDVTYKLYLHHYLNHKLSQLTRCYVTYVDEPHCHFVYGTTLCGDGLVNVLEDAMCLVSR